MGSVRGADPARSSYHELLPPNGLRRSGGSSRSRDPGRFPTCEPQPRDEHRQRRRLIAPDHPPVGQGVGALRQGFLADLPADRVGLRRSTPPGRSPAGSAPRPRARPAAPAPPAPDASRPPSPHPGLPFTARALPQGPGMLRFTPDSAFSSGLAPCCEQISRKGSASTNSPAVSLEPVMDQALVHHLCSALDPVQSGHA